MHPLVKIDRRVLARVRRICLGWPAVEESIKWGRPHFTAGKKLFGCVDRTHERPEFVLTPYSAHQGWVSLYTDGPFDWDEVEEYLRVGYRLVANKRMLAAMDA